MQVVSCVMLAAFDPTFWLSRESSLVVLDLGEDPMTVVFAVFAVLIALLITLVTTVSVIQNRKERERQDRVARWAAAHGWSVAKKPAVSWARQLPNQHGTVPLLVYAWVGVLAVGVADYTFTTVTRSSGPDGQSSMTTTTRHDLLVTTVRLPHRYPAIAVVRRGALSRLGRVMFGDGTCATGNAEFDRRFRIRTRYPDIARALVGPALTAEHLAERLPTWSLVDQDLVTWQNGRIGHPEQIPALVEPLTRVARLLAPMPW